MKWQTICRSWLLLAHFGCLLLDMADSTTTPEAAFLTVKQAADRLAVSIWTVYTLLDSGELAGVYQGRRRYVTPAAIDAYIASLRPTPAEPESATA